MTLMMGLIIQYGMLLLQLLISEIVVLKIQDHPVKLGDDRIEGYSYFLLSFPRKWESCV